MVKQVTSVFSISFIGEANRVYKNVKVRIIIMIIIHTFNRIKIIVVITKNNDFISVQLLVGGS